jgi:hypothetical protein
LSAYAVWLGDQLRQTFRSLSESEDQDQNMAGPQNTTREKKMALARTMMTPGPDGKGKLAGMWKKVVKFEFDLDSRSFVDLKLKLCS